MTTDNTFLVDEIIREPQAGSEDNLVLTPGVNVLVGPPNTGKTKWLQMLNYLLTSEEEPADVFGEFVAAKYTSVLARLTVAGEQIEVERRWNDNSPKNRVVVNGDPTTVKDFLGALLTRLHIPSLHYPQGDPYGKRTWPELGWKSLYRHMYRRQLLWSDIADKQPESEQHACILQFTGIAERLFSDEYGQLVEKQKKILELQAKKEHFLATLSEVSKDLLSAEEVGVGLTPQSLEAARQRVSGEMEHLQNERASLLTSLATSLNAGAQLPESKNRIDELATESSDLEVRDEDVQTAFQRLCNRLDEMTLYRSSVEQELGRLERAMKAGNVLADLKVTHCPACDQPVVQEAAGSLCYLCHRPLSATPTTASVERLELEISQSKANLAEATEMIGMLERDKERLRAEGESIRARIVQVRSMLRPVRMAVAALLPPEIAVLDMKMGQLQERLAQIGRVEASLAHREVLTGEIEQIQRESASLEEEVARQSGTLDFDRASDQLQDGMNTYLNAIKKAVPKAWTQKEARVRLDERKARFLVGDRKWAAQLGGTLSLYYLIAYHYALMSLTPHQSCHFPGFLAIDFPAELDGASIRDEENFAIEPFVSLLAGEAFQKCQLLAAGAAFENLQGVNRIEFTKVWD